ncbi:MAG: hypothetical protein JXR30_03820 [Alphaproteobacteria bacterium]|nr:hypothetical protein [Alphaproteobacteria bacterium]
MKKILVLFVGMMISFSFSLFAETDAEGAKKCYANVYKDWWEALKTTDLIYDTSRKDITAKMQACAKAAGYETYSSDY